jgi:hypothetical protein
LKPKAGARVAVCERARQEGVRGDRRSEKRESSVLRRGILPALAAALWLLGSAVAAEAHGGYPLRLGIGGGPDLVLLGRLVLVYLREGQGMTVDPVFLGEDTDPAGEYGKGKIDLFLDAPPERWLAGRCPGNADASTGEETARDYFREAFPGSWQGMFTFALGASPCAVPALAAHEKVVKDLRFSLMRETLEKLLPELGAEDLERMRKEGGSDPRKASSAARKILGEKGLL